MADSNQEIVNLLPRGIRGWTQLKSPLSALQEVGAVITFPAGSKENYDKRVREIWALYKDQKKSSCEAKEVEHDFRILVQVLRDYARGLKKLMRSGGKPAVGSTIECSDEEARVGSSSEEIKTHASWWSCSRRR